MIFSTAWRTVLPILLGGYVAVAQDVGSSEESSRNLRRDKSPPPPPPPPLVDHLFTYGAPSVAGNPAVANPGNKCGKTICNSRLLCLSISALHLEGVEYVWFKLCCSLVT